MLGVSGRAMLRALLAGERDPAALAALARGRLRNELPELREALRGRFDAHHALLLRLALEHVEQLERSIAELDAALDRVIAPFAAARDHLGPGNNITGGKRRSGRTRKGNVWLGDVLVECAWATAQSRDTYLAAQFWRLARRLGKKKAAIAVGHSILVIAWHLLANDCDHADLGGDFFVRRDSDRARQRAVAQLQAHGYHVTLEPTAA